MRPTLQARGLKESLLQYLSTTYALSDEGAREALHRFLGDETSGMFRGPYLRIRAPFTTADDGWREHLEWRREGFTPYAHQAVAFARLTSANGHTPQPTLITTGTGSGKTESFLYPVLDHCRREREAGKAGVKAVFLYPMNALATDQAQRINELLTQNSELGKVWAGLYIGDRAATQYEKVRTRRFDMQLSPPDILITNYKMLDLLLQREEDAPLWQESDIRYIVVDEFHTYDGAQGTDVAMLLRRLASAVGASEKGRPLGRICPVATSATLASGTDEDGMARLLEVATDVFGTEFTPESIVGENRLSVEEFIPLTEVRMQGLPTPDELLALPDPAFSGEALLDLIEAVTGVRDADPFRLGENLKRHLFTRAVMQALDGEVKTSAEVLDLMWRAGAAGWAEAVARQPEKAAEALARFVALMSYARDPKSTPKEPRPFVHVEVHQWARSLSRLLRGVLPWPKAEFRWDVAGTADASATDGERTVPVTTATSGQSANLFLPAVYCRACGRSGWAVFSPESDDHDIQFDTFKIRRASLGQDKARVRNLIAATDREAREGSGAAPMSAGGRSTGGSTTGQGAGGMLMVLDGARKRLRLPDPLNDYDKDTKEPRLTARDSAFVLVHFGGTVANTAAREDWCPACGERNAIRYLGTGSAAMAAASITQLFTGGELDKELHEDKTLMFNDSVQDAAHRAGFVANRSYTFSLRALLAKHLRHDEPTALNDLIADVVEATTDKDTLAAVVPPDLHVYKGVERLLSGEGRGGSMPVWRLVGQRLAFETLMEFGFRSRNGRTLELTRTAAAHVRIDDPAAVVALVKRIHEECVRDGVPLVAQDDARYLGLVRVFLERLRTRGAVAHKWLDKYIDEAGTSRYFIWGKRAPGMRAFPKRVAAPVFLLSSPKNGSEFDSATGRLSWYERWATRCLDLPREMTPEFWTRLLPELSALGLLSVRTPRDTSLRVYGLKPGNIEAQLLDDEQVRHAYVRCPVCFWEQTVHPSLLDQWHEQPCPSYRCRTGRLVAGDRPEGLGVHHRDRDYTQDYYRRLYRGAGVYQVVTAEHTGMLTRPQREQVENAFKRREGFKDPNVLSCTPTLEMGIDIGDLSAVVLAALPRRPASYAQQVGRAGRRTGNAFLLTIPDRRRRDLYFLERPKDLIAGTIVPPGCYLSAVEILRRQYLAHLLDLAAAGRLVRPDGTALRALPRKAPRLFGPSGYLADLVELAIAQGEELVEGFLELFPTGVSDQAKDDLRRYATHELRGKVEEAEREWFRAQQALRARLKEIDEAHDELHDSDPDQARQKAELDAERRGVGRRLMNLGETPVQTALCDLGLLPNYALIDSTTVLSATLYGENEADPTKYTSDTYAYERPRRLALEELAPGNTFYVNGYKHQISGIEIATGGRQEWRTWRVCPGCGYVRTENAAEDRSPCPRCKTAHIADDGSCLFQIVEPATVTSRDKREDARIRDDKDDRDRRFYRVVDAVDIPLEDIEPGAWRHKNQTFGVDYCRRAMIRRINVGPVRFDSRDRDDFAGQRVRLNPFHVCTACGAASADGQPVFDHDTDELDSLAARSGRLKHHRPWCPLRRGKKTDAREEPVLLAHQLQTEALRVLIPAATADVDAKVHSFRAALRLGVDLHFGGDPQHLDTTVASMPDTDSGERRWFLVLFDSLPGGTGYLDRLTKPDAFRDTLMAAYEMLKECPCAEEQRRACHRCLHRYTPEPFQDIVSRRLALTMLESLLFTKDGEDGWETTEVEHTGLVGLDAQVESDLEARFLAALRAWVKVTDDASLDEDGHASGHLRFTGDSRDSDVVHWRLTAQQQLRGTVSDFTFTRVDGPAQSVKVYLEGFRFHASREHNQIAADAAKRTRLRAEGEIVFQITWADIDLFEQSPTRAKPVWPPYRATAQEQAKTAYEQYGGQRAHFANAVFANPIDTLIAYLRDPDPERWARRARALVTGLTAQPGTTPVAPTGRRSELVAALRDQLATFSPAERHDKPVVPETAGIGPVHVFRAQDDTGLPIVFALDAADPENLKWTALTVLDDSDAVLETDEHKERWRSWLYWTNLTQFLSLAGGDGVQLATSKVAEFEVEVLAICGGLGELDSLIGTPAPAGAEAPAARVKPVDPDPGHATAAEVAVARILRDAAWDEEILEILREEPDESPDLLRLAEILADRGKVAPVFGHELGTSRWQADFAWHTHGIKIAVVPAHQGEEDDEAQRRDAAYIEDGWTVRTAAEWLAHLDELLDQLPDTEEGAAR
ncbi:DEAD/DEAH box helicase [Streptomonospora nanhaiensis]|uniref:DEAD/DEAH box helicase n=1 Tax=Streptomonospora nanhaiensis TaxID=1323731 RepID=UPI001C386231|nr:DEAD/DEAH box helicase [Streptomonospora nanhaiensis]MBV2366825.1 DEAD/DEAH box helicase [Streptomonospora nanhaiensis]